jgi:protein TonB
MHDRDGRVVVSDAPCATKWATKVQFVFVKADKFRDRLAQPSILPLSHSSYRAHHFFTIVQPRVHEPDALCDSERICSMFGSDAEVVMFGELLESGPRRPQRRAGMLVSVVVHSFTILLGVWATGMGDPPPLAPPREVAIAVLQQPITSAPPAEHTRVPDGGGVATAPAIPVPTPVRLPVIDEMSSTLPPPRETLGNLFDSLNNGSPLASHVRGAGVKAPGRGGVLDNTVVDKPALPLDGNQPPQYPELLRRAGITGIVVVEFIIDSSGRVQPGSVLAARSDDSRFLEAVREALGTHRFLPAEVGGRRIAVKVRQVFAFELND